MKKKEKKEYSQEEFMEELRRALQEPDTDYDLPPHVPLKKGQVVATFIKRKEGV
jgi:hypothetical protein